MQLGCAGTELPGGMKASSVQGTATDLPPGVWVPFSFGPRDCVGKRMGQLQVRCPHPASPVLSSS